MGDPATDCPYRCHRASVDTKNPNPGGRARRACEFGQHWGVIYDTLRRRLPSRGVWSPGLNRFAWAQCFSGAADAMVAVSLAGSLFFNLSPEASRQQILFYLVINLAPYALMAPLVGPAIDRLRHGPRNIAVFLFALRAVCAAGLALTLLDLGFYFFALALLIAAKATGVTRQALTPGLVDDSSQLVSANSRLARLNVIAGTVGGAVGAALLAISTPMVAASGAAVLFVGAAIATLRVPDPARWPEAPASVVYEELHRPTIVATSWAFTVVRAAVGFFVFGLAFALRRESEPAWMYGATVAAYGAGAFAGNAVAPVMRRRYGEDRLMAAALIVLAIVAAFGALGPSRLLVVLVAIVLGGAGSVARQAFDSLVQTAAPTATHGRAFARFETRFQVAWVLGAVAATGIGIPIQISLAIVAVGLVPAALLYVLSLREAQRAHVGDPFDPVELARRRLEHAAEWHERELDRLAVTELSGVIDLARATGMPLAAETVSRMDELRSIALSTWPIDTRDIEWALARVGELVDRLERRARGEQSPSLPVERRGRQDSGNSDDEVTTQFDESAAKLKTALDTSRSER